MVAGSELALVYHALTAWLLASLLNKLSRRLTARVP